MGADGRPRVTALVLAAGQSRRMSAGNKLLLELDGQPMIARVVAEVCATPMADVIVVTGHQAPAVSAALAAQPVRLVHNPDYRLGLSCSLRAGLDALGEQPDALLVCLGDMPGVTRKHIGRLLAAFDPDTGRDICVPCHDGRRGNPVLWGRRYLTRMRQLDGDIGARSLLIEHADRIRAVAMDDPGVLSDIDTPAALAQWRRACLSR